MNNELVHAFNTGITNPNFEHAPGYCCRWIRECVEDTYPDTYDGLFSGSANQTGLNFLDAGWGQHSQLAGAIQPGDILVKEFAPFGHIGGAVPDPNRPGKIRVAENSSTRIGRIDGACGYRQLEIWGTPAIVVRLPESKPPTPQGYIFMLNTTIVCSMPVQNGQSICPVSAYAHALGLDVDWDENTSRVIIAGKTLQDTPMIINNKAYLPIRTLVTFAGLTMNVDDQKRIVTVSH